MLRQYAQIVGVVLLLLGVVGLLLGDEVFLGVLNIDLVEDIVHLLTGGLLAYVGFGRTDEGTTRTVVGALGVVYLLVGILGFVVPTLFGLIPNGYTIVDNLVHLALGALALVVAGVPGRSTAARH
jgi:preprotein translocase subunit Sss1